MRYFKFPLDEIHKGQKLLYIFNGTVHIGKN